MRAHDIGKVTFSGSAADDPEILSLLPDELTSLLGDTNGFVLFNGGLHVRGAVRVPVWHSIRAMMEGEEALHKLYAAVMQTDIPFAEDCVGDQFLLRAGEVWRLEAETGAIEKIAGSLALFLAAIAKDPYEALNFNPDLRLEPGQLLHAYPPFCTKESQGGVSLKPVPTLELIRFHADFAKQLAALPEGASIKIKVVD
jgi:hypothetical protein